MIYLHCSILPWKKPSRKYYQIWVTKIRLTLLTNQLSHQVLCMLTPKLISNLLSQLGYMSSSFFFLESVEFIFFVTGHLLKECNSTVFSMFIELCNQIKFRTYSSPKQKPIFISSHSPFLPNHQFPQV